MQEIMKMNKILGLVPTLAIAYFFFNLASPEIELLAIMLFSAILKLQNIAGTHADMQLPWLLIYPN